jgi:hypothetical protein
MNINNIDRFKMNFGEIKNDCANRWKWCSENSRKVIDWIGSRVQNQIKKVKELCKNRACGKEDQKVGPKESENTLSVNCKTNKIWYQGRGFIRSFTLKHQIWFSRSYYAEMQVKILLSEIINCGLEEKDIVDEYKREVLFAFFLIRLHTWINDNKKKSILFFNTHQEDGLDGIDKLWDSEKQKESMVKKLLPIWHGALASYKMNLDDCPVQFEELFDISASLQFHIILPKEEIKVKFFSKRTDLIQDRVIPFEKKETTFPLVKEEKS